MINILSQNLSALFYIFFLALFVLLSVLFVAIFIKQSQKKYISIKLDNFYLKIKDEIRSAVAPKFLTMSVEASEITDLAIEIWRIEQRIARSTSSLPENQLKGLENSIEKIKRYLEKYDVEIVDYKNQKYNEGLNFDILSVEKDPSLLESIIKETVEPTIMLKGQVVRKAKIILLSNH